MIKNGTPSAKVGCRFLFCDSFAFAAQKVLSAGAG